MKTHVALVLHEGSKVLFVQRSEKKKVLPGAWAVPSGTMEEGESVAETAIREAKEELGIDIIIGNEIAQVPLEQAGVLLRFVACTVASGTPVIAEPDEIQALSWMTLKDFYLTYTDDQIGHGLRVLRTHPQFLQELA